MSTTRFASLSLTADGVGSLLGLPAELLRCVGAALAAPSLCALSRPPQGRSQPR